MVQTWGASSSLINVNELTDYVRFQAQNMQAFSQVCVPPTGLAMGMGVGDTGQYTYYKKISNAGGELDENEPIPEGNITPIKSTFQIKEHGNSVKYTGKYEAFCRLDVKDPFIKALADDLRALENKLAFTAANATSWQISLKASAREFVTNATPTQVADSDLSLVNLRFISRKAKANKIPKFDGERYVLITGVDSSDAARYDTDVTTAVARAASDSGRAALNGEVGSIAECRIVEDTDQIVKIGSTQFDTSFLIGGDAILNEYALLPELREDVSDHKRSMSLAYYFLAAWSRIMNQTDHGQEHVIKVTSA